MLSKPKLACVLFLSIATVLLGATFQPNVSFKHETENVHPRTNTSTNDLLTLNRYLETLVATHPKSEISVEFYQLIERGEVMTSWTSGNSAEFQLVPRHMINGSVLPTRDLTPFLSIDPQILSERPTRFAQLVIYHEYIHYRQWKDGLLPQSTFVLRKMESLSPEAFKKNCKEKWYAEEDAYQRECELAVELGWTDTMPLCKQLNAPTFKNRLLGSLITEGGTLNACSHALTDLL